MPIRPENKLLYPDNWPEIRQRIRARAGDKCEGCGVKNGAIGWREPFGKFIEAENSCAFEVFADENKINVFKIVCTTAHLDHDPQNCEDENLKFWCQKCHNGTTPSTGPTE